MSARPRASFASRISSALIRTAFVRSKPPGPRRVRGIHMRDEQTPNPADDDESPGSRAQGTSWVEASGTTLEAVGERAPRLHWMLVVVGPLGLAVSILTSLWNSGRHVERSVNVQVETSWVAGEQLAIRTQVVDYGLEPLADVSAVGLRIVDDDGTVHDLGELTEIGPGVAQGVLLVPTLAPGAGELVLHYETSESSRIEPFDERLPIEIVEARGKDAGRLVVSENMLQWADDTDEQPAGVRIDLRPDGRLLAGFHNRLFVRVTDVAGRPWKPAAGEPRIQVLLASGEFGGVMGDGEKPPVLFDGPVDSLGLASFEGELRSDAVRFEIRLVGDVEIAAAKAAAEPKPPEPATPPATDPPASAPPASAPPAPAPPASPYLSGPKRRLRFVSHAGTVRVIASTDFVHPGDEVTITVDAISARRPAFVDIHGPSGAWFDTVTPPLLVPQEYKFEIPRELGVDLSGGPFIQFEAYQSTLRPEDSSAIARIQLAPAGGVRRDLLAPLIERQREQLSLPRVDRQFEIGCERAYLNHVETTMRGGATRSGGPSEADVERARAFLIGSLAAVVHGPPQALNTRAREDQDMATSKRAWTLAVRWFLLGGGGLFIFVMATMVWRNQRQLERRTTDALGLAPGSGNVDEEMFADHSLALMRARREMLGRGIITIALMTAALLMTVLLLESLVWEY
jgi:hypothetical protein